MNSLTPFTPYCMLSAELYRLLCQVKSLWPQPSFSSDRYCLMERAVFEVSAVAFDLNAAKEGDVSQFSAEEYLAWVVHEASTLPDVIRVQSTDEMDGTLVHGAPQEIQTRAASPLRPTLAWERGLMRRFSCLTKVKLQILCCIHVMWCSSSALCERRVGERGKWLYHL